MQDRLSRSRCAPGRHALAPRAECRDSRMVLRGGWAWRPALTALLMIGFAVEARGQAVCRPGEPCFQGSASGPASVVRVRNELARATSLGSGTLVAKDARYGWIVTVAHLFDEGTGRVSALFPAANHRYYAEVVAVDRRHDLALLAIRPPRAAPSPVAARPPSPGARLVFHGFGQGTYRAAAGVARRAVSLDGGHSFDALQWSGAARQGDSGGPVFNPRGELVAVIAGSDGRASVGSDCTRVRALLEEYLPRFQEPEGEGGRREAGDGPSSAPSENLARLREEVAALRKQWEQRPAAPACDCPPPPSARQLETLAARLTALEEAFSGQIRYRLRRVPVK